MRISLQRNAVVVASAGTGKTHALVGVILTLLLGASADAKGRVRSRVAPKEIVATTFSRKAAAEMRARVAKELEILGDSRSKSVYDAWIADALAESGTPMWLPDERAERARTALGHLSELRVLTLHAFAMTIVRTYALEAGMLPGVDVMTESEDRRVTELAIERTIDAFVQDVGADARAIFDAIGSYAGVVAEVRALLDRICESGRGASELLVSTAERSRIEHDFQLIVTMATELASVDPSFEEARVLARSSTNADERVVLEALRAFLAIDYRKRSAEAERFRTFRAAMPGATHDLRATHFSRLYARRAEVTRVTEAARTLLTNCANAVLLEKKRLNVLGFSDVLVAARSVLLHHEAARRETTKDIDTLLVDELQDTSRLQRDLVVLLRQLDPKNASLHLSAVARRGLFVVGDRKQSIYGFRGADVSVFAELAVGLAGEPAQKALEIPDGFVWRPNEPHADFFALRNNRRGEPALLQFANAMSERLFSPAEDPPAPYEIFYSPTAEDLVSPRALTDADAAARTTWVRPAFSGAATTRMEDAIACAAVAAREIHEAVPLAKTGKAPSWKDVAILSLTNETLEKSAFALARRGIPFVVAGRGFFRAREVADVVSLLDVLIDPADRHALLAVLRGPCAALSDESIVALTDPKYGLRKLDSRILEGPRRELLREHERARVETLRDVVARLSGTVTALGPGRVLREALRALDFEETLAQLPRGAERIANVRKLLALADEAMNAREFSSEMHDAMKRELAESDAATFSEDDDAVRLLTVHASKGLDFPIVIVPEAGAPFVARTQGSLHAVATDTGDDATELAIRFYDEEGKIVLNPPAFLAARARLARRDRAERQRLVYVAMTRASDRMFFVGARKPGKNAERDETAMAASLGSILENEPALLLARDEAASVIANEDESASARARDEAHETPEFTVDRTRVRALTLAPTALSDFAHCARRFHLVHDVGLPEFRARDRDSSDAITEADLGALDSRREGTLLHAILERVPKEAFGAEDAEAHVRAVAARMGVRDDEAHFAFVVTRATRFLQSMYCARMRAEGAEIERETPFVVDANGHVGNASTEAGPRVLLRGTMDLVVRFPNGETHVVDYKRARGSDPSPYAFQLDVYALAARARWGSVAGRGEAGGRGEGEGGGDGNVVVKTALVFLGGKSAEPVFFSPRGSEETARELLRLGARLVEARWKGLFPRVEVDACHSIVCGYVGRCHPRKHDESTDS